MNDQEPQYSILPSDPSVLKDILSIIDECVDSKVRQAAERDFVKEQVKALSEQHEIKAKYLNKFIRLRYKQDAEAVRQETEETVDAFSKLEQAGKK